MSRGRCEVCGAVYGTVSSVRYSHTGAKSLIHRAEHIHHLLPRRWLDGHGIREHQEGNLISVCSGCHGRAKEHEDRLFQGDLFAFLQGMKQIGFPVAKIVDFALAHGLKEFAAFHFLALTDEKS